jgi:hypothetical protein
VRAEVTPVKVRVGEQARFSAVVDHDNCSGLAYLWTFDDSTTSDEASPTHAFLEPGIHEVDLKVMCDDCDSASDAVVVTVACAEVEITGADPLIDFMCPGCTVQHTAMTEPPGQAVFWSAESETLGGQAQIDMNGLLTLGSNVPPGTHFVTVRASTTTDASDCVDERRQGTYVPPPDDVLDDERTPSELRFVREHPWCAFRLWGVQQECRRVTTEHVIRPADGTLPNAWQHAYCSCVAASRCGTDLAKEIGDAHEAYRKRTIRFPFEEIPQSCAHYSMDLHNNAVGVRVSTGDEGMCVQLIDQALIDDQLRWMDPVDPEGCPSLTGWSR